MLTIRDFTQYFLYISQLLHAIAAVCASWAYDYFTNSLFLLVTIVLIILRPMGIGCGTVVSDFVWSYCDKADQLAYVHVCVFGSSGTGLI